MNVERLLRLATHLDTVPPARFNLDRWSCDSVACACGHACDIPEFREAGLFLGQETDDSEEYVTEHGLQLSYQDPTNGEYYWDVEAAEKFFDLCEQDAVHLFYSKSYPDQERTTPAQVAQRIREFVQKRQVPAVTVSSVYAVCSGFPAITEVPSHA